MLKLKLQYFGHLMRRTDSLEKTEAGKNWRQEEKRTTEYEMVEWHHQLNGHEFEQAPGIGDGQGNLVCYIPWGHKELDTTEWLNWTDMYIQINVHSLTCVHVCVPIQTNSCILCFFIQIYYKRCSTYWFILPNNLSWWSLFNSRVRLSSFILTAKQYSISVYLSSLLNVSIDPPTSIFLIKIPLQWSLYVTFCTTVSIF